MDHCCDRSSTPSLRETFEFVERSSVLQMLLKSRALKIKTQSGSVPAYGSAVKVATSRCKEFMGQLALRNTKLALHASGKLLPTG
jgi:hypothetical protein